MKSKTHIRTVILSTLFFLTFASVQLASAYYDPGLQRWLNRDPIGERSDNNVFAFARNSPIDRFDIVGLDSNADRPAPVYDPTFWNDPSRIEVNNCYNYACDRPQHDVHSTFNQPGAGTQAGMGRVTSCEKLIYRVTVLDGGKKPDGSGNCPAGYHKARAWFKPNDFDSDFHFYRQDADGSWSHKSGNTAACQVKDPSTYNDYQNCGDVCLKNQPPH